MAKLSDFGTASDKPTPVAPSTQKTLTGTLEAAKGVRAQRFLEGGFVSDVFDVINIPSFAVGGALEGVGPKEGIRQRISPSEALGLESAIPSLAADIATDPLTFITFGATGVAKIGGKALSRLGKKSLKASTERALGEELAKGVEKELAEQTAQNVARQELAQRIPNQPELLTRNTILEFGLPGSQTVRAGVELPFSVSQQIGRVTSPIAKIPGVKQAANLVRKAGAPVADFFKRTFDPFAKIKKFDGLNDVQKATLINAKRELEVGRELAQKTAVEVAAKIDAGDELASIARNIIEEAGRDAESLRFLDPKAVVKSVDDLIKDTKKELKLTPKEVSKLKQVVGDFKNVINKQEKVFETIAQGRKVGRIEKIGFFPRKGVSKSAQAQDQIITRSGKKIQEFEKRVFFEPVDIEAPTRTGQIASVGKKGLDVLEEGGIKASRLSDAQREAFITSLSTDARKFVGAGDLFRGADGKVLALNELTFKETVDRLKKIDPEQAKAFEAQSAVESLAGDIASKQRAQVEQKFLQDVRGVLEEPFKDISTDKVAKTISEMNKLPDGFIDGEKLTGSALLKGINVPNAIADEIGSVVQKYGTTEVDKWLRKYDELQGWWKTFALVGPAYHARNFVSDTFNKFLGNGYSVGAEVKSMRLLGAGGDVILEKGGLAGKKLSKLTKADQRLVQAATNFGVIDNGFVSSEIGEALQDQLAKTTWNPLSRKGKLARTSRTIGVWAENQRRLGMFIKKVDDGLSFREAAMEVKKYLFDYAELTATEQQVFKRLAPFYTFTRKNLPLQLKAVTREPGKLGLISKIQTAIEPEDAEEVKENLPRWIKSGHPLVLPFRGKNGEAIVVPLEGILPVFDLSKLPSDESLGAIIDMLSPVIKQPLEFGMNRDFFRGIDIEELADEGQPIFDQLNNIPWLNNKGTVNEFLGGMFNNTQAKAIRDNYRPIREIDNLFQPGKGNEKDPLSERLAKTFLFRVNLVDLAEAKGIEEWLTGKDKEELSGRLRSFQKKAQSNPTKTNIQNLKKYRQALADLGVAEEDIVKEESKGKASSVKFDIAEPRIKAEIKEFGKVSGATKKDLIDQLFETGNFKKRATARRAITSLIKENQ